MWGLIQNTCFGSSEDKHNRHFALDVFSSFEMKEFFYYKTNCEIDNIVSKQASLRFEQNSAFPERSDKSILC